jgi:integrase
MEVSAMASIQVRKETGSLILDFYYRGRRCREQTALSDTPANRKKLQKVPFSPSRSINPLVCCLALAPCSS